MKIKMTLLTLLPMVVFGAGPAQAEAKSKLAAPAPFHAAESPAEKALDAIFRRVDKDDNIVFYVRGTPSYDAKKDTGYSRLFTERFLRAAAQMESDAVKKKCEGKYREGELCGLDFNPVNCARNIIGESGYFHLTIRDDGRQVIISSLGGDYDPGEVNATYKLIKVGDGWRLDGVDCGGIGESVGFKMDCGISDCDASDLRKRAAQGDADAQYNLGIMYQIGRDVEQDFDESTRWYRKAAEQGHAEAQYDVGIMYHIGRGVQRDDAEAAKWYRKAAEKGYGGAQFRLGLMYEKGRGVPQDHAEAMSWYRKAAERGDSDAQYSLGMMYQTGTGVKKDLAEGEKLLRKAAERGHAGAGREVEKLDRR